MIVLKSCPRCRGDLTREQISDDIELVCIKCGFRKDVNGLLRAVTGGRGRAQKPPEVAAVGSGL